MFEDDPSTENSHLRNMRISILKKSKDQTVGFSKREKYPVFIKTENLFSTGRSSVFNYVVI